MFPITQSLTNGGVGDHTDLALDMYMNPSICVNSILSTTYMNFCDYIDTVNCLSLQRDHYIR